MEAKMPAQAQKRAIDGNKIAHSSAPNSNIEMNPVILNLSASGCQMARACAESGNRVHHAEQIGRAFLRPGRSLGAGNETASRSSCKICDGTGWAGRSGIMNVPSRIGFGAP
jgi:hypothetical protein